MEDNWEKQLACAIECSKCDHKLNSTDERILSIYDHQPICMECKKKEEKKPDYAEVARRMIGHCMAETELLYSDPEGYCYHHFYPFKC